MASKKPPKPTKESANKVLQDFMAEKGIVILKGYPKCSINRNGVLVFGEIPVNAAYQEDLKPPEGGDDGGKNGEYLPN